MIKVGEKRKRQGDRKVNADNIINPDIFLSFTYEVLLPERSSIPKIEGAEEQLKWHQVNPKYGTFYMTNGLASLKSSSQKEKKRRQDNCLLF